jgi:hypothetical protein
MRVPPSFTLCRELAHADPKADGKLAAEAARRPSPSAAAPDTPLPAEYWDSVLKDPRADATGAQMRLRRFLRRQSNRTRHLFSLYSNSE